MQNVTTLMVLAAGLFFSVTCALLIEELLFGGLFRLVFARQAERKSGQEKEIRRGEHHAGI